MSPGTCQDQTLYILCGTAKQKVPALMKHETHANEKLMGNTAGDMSLGNIMKTE